MWGSFGRYAGPIGTDDLLEVVCTLEKLLASIFLSQQVKSCVAGGQLLQEYIQETIFIDMIDMMMSARDRQRGVVWCGVVWLNVAGAGGSC